MNQEKVVKDYETWAINYSEDDTEEERKAWEEEVKQDRRVWNTPQATKAVDKLVEDIVTGKVKTRPARDSIKELRKYVEEERAREQRQNI
jgi:hypothetical protein